MQDEKADWRDPRWIAEEVDAAIREAGERGEAWTPRLDKAAARYGHGRPIVIGSLHRRLLRQARELIDPIKESDGPGGVQRLLDFKTREVSALVAEHAPHLSDAQIACLLGRTHTAPLLRNPNLSPQVQVAIIRGLVAPLRDDSGRTSADWNDESLGGIRAALSLPGPVKAAGWAGVSHGSAEALGLRALATPLPDPDLIADISAGNSWGRMCALVRPDLNPDMEDRLLGGDKAAMYYIAGNWSRTYEPSASVMRRAANLWPGHVAIAARIASFPGAPLDLLRELARKWRRAGDVLKPLAYRDDTLADPDIRAVLMECPVAHEWLIGDATAKEFPGLFRSVAPIHPRRASTALQVRLGRGVPHGLQPDDMVPLFAAGGDVAKNACGLLAEIARDGASHANTDQTRPTAVPAQIRKRRQP